jgi:hypothetical protein
MVYIVYHEELYLSRVDLAFDGRKYGKSLADLWKL